MQSRSFGAFAPVSKAERERVLGRLAPTPAARPAELPASAVEVPPAPPAPAAVAAPAPAAPAAVSEPPAPKLVPRFVGGRLRYLEVPIDSPIEHEGRIWDAIPLRRPGAKEVGEYFERLLDAAATNSQAVLRFPIYAEEDGTPVPSEVLDFLDLDDQEALAAAAEDFLPDRLRRFQAALQHASRSPAGDSTEPTSSNS